MEPLYFISTYTLEEAQNIATDKGLVDSQWVHCPQRNELQRQQSINGRRAISKDYLIGIFSAREENQLLPNSKPPGRITMI